MSRRFDVAVVGGGPAGASLAIFLARAHGVAGGRVLVLDKARFPREKPCAGAISSWGLRALEAVDVTVDVPRVVMRGVRVLDGENVQTARMSDLGIVVRRSELDHALLRRAEADGAVVREGEGLVGLSRVAAGWTLRTGAGVDVEARILVAADGAGSTTRRLLGLAEPHRKGHLYVLETAELASDAGPRDGLCDFDLAPNDAGIEGYYWDFPTTIDGARAVSRGIYHANLSRGREPKPALASSLRARGLDIADVRLKPFPTRPFVPRSQTGGEGFLLAGEACGIDATTGEGIAQAILMSRIAARHVAAALRAGALDHAAYGRDLRASRIGRHLRESAWLCPHVYGSRGGAFRRYLVRSPYACASGARWYKGEPLGLGAHARLAVGLGAALAGITLRRPTTSAPA